MTKTSWRLIFVLPLTVVLMMSVAPAVPGEMSAQEMELLIAKVRADKKLFISQNMQLTQTESVGFWPVYSRYQKELESLAARSIALIEDYARSHASLDDATAHELLDRYLAIESDRLKTRRAYLPAFRGVLSDKKVARYYQLENKIRAMARVELAARIPLVQ